MPHRNEGIPDEVAIEEYFMFKKQQFELEDLRVMTLQSIRNLNLFATFAAGYIGLTSSVHEDRVFLMELKECSKRIHEIPQFIFYVLGYAIERVLSMSRKGINGFLPRKVKSQQLNLFEHFKIKDAFAFKKWGNSKKSGVDRTEEMAYY